MFLAKFHVTCFRNMGDDLMTLLQKLDVKRALNQVIKNENPN